jgi:hypothetical protein
VQEGFAANTHFWCLRSIEAVGAFGQAQRAERRVLVPGYTQDSLDQSFDSISPAFAGGQRGLRLTRRGSRGRLSGKGEAQNGNSGENENEKKGSHWACRPYLPRRAVFLLNSSSSPKAISGVA